METFWHQMAAYYTTTLPVQVILAIAAGILAYHVLARDGDIASGLTKAFLPLRRKEGSWEAGAG